jgi:hypothetical protein
MTSAISQRYSALLTASLSLPAAPEIVTATPIPPTPAVPVQFSNELPLRELLAISSWAEFKQLHRNEFKDSAVWRRCNSRFKKYVERNKLGNYDQAWDNYLQDELSKSRLKVRRGRRRKSIA